MSDCSVILGTIGTHSKTLDSGAQVRSKIIENIKTFAPKLTS